MTAQPVMRDERTVATENASYRLAYLVMSFGLLACVAYRSFALGQSSWDLLALLLLGGGVAAAFQGRQRVLTARWARLAVVALIVAAVLGVAASALRR